VQVKDRAKVDLQKPYGTNVIGDIIAVQWYQSTGSDGMKFKKHFGDMPIALIALVCTVVRIIFTVCSSILTIYLHFLDRKCSVGALKW